MKKKFIIKEEELMNNKLTIVAEFDIESHFGMTDEKEIDERVLLNYFKTECGWLEESGIYLKEDSVSLK